MICAFRALLQMAYIMSVNANIIADTGGPCSTADCTVSLQLLTCSYRRMLAAIIITMDVHLDAGC